MRLDILNHDEPMYGPPVCPHCGEVTPLPGLHNWQVRAELARLRAENSLLQRTAERAILEARVWAQEAKTQRATVREGYQIITGFQGEPGDWNGAKPIRVVMDVLERLRAENAQLRAKLARRLPTSDERRATSKGELA